MFSFISNSYCRRKVLSEQIFLKARISTGTVNPKKPSLVLLTITGVGAGALLGGGYSYFANLKSRLPVGNESDSSASPVIKNFPDVSISRRVSVKF